MKYQSGAWGKGSSYIALIAAGMCSNAAWAQNDASYSGLDAIVVEARRVSEDLQDVPLSVAALGEEALAARGIASLTDMKAAVPNLQIVKTNIPGGNIMQLRGLSGANVPNVSIDSAVGLYVDGVYLARPQSSGGEIPDLARVEVLRGPQGTLSGRNALAGAINFVTAEPSGEWGAIVEGTVGNQGRIRGRATINTGTYGGFSARVTYIHDENTGAIRNTAQRTSYDWGKLHGRYTTAKKAFANNIDSVMAKLRFESDALTLTYKFDRTDQIEHYPGVTTTGFPTTALGQSGANLYFLQAPGTVPLFRDRPDYIHQSQFAPARISSLGHTLTGQLDLADSLYVKSITAYREISAFAQADVDAMETLVPTGSGTSRPLCLSCSVLGTTQDQFSQEFQLIGSYDRFSFILGGLYFREKGYSEWAFMHGKSLVPGTDGTIPLVPADFAIGNKERATNTSYAGYGQASFDITENLNLAVGLRYTLDKRLSFDERPMVPLRGFVDYNSFDYDVAITYEFNPDIRVYARHATGYVSGGIVKQIVFRPQEAKSYEVGFKSDCLIGGSV